ncbi:putative F-box protein [Raphanus sativus]|uniref:F-box protein At1g32420 n=1 Tax=Raphanus sativus TaxID=3726 RepID=A0A6J0LEX1_RAPSA|nr:putative F-box protein At1g32420 [Raphanus sativus]KAJ4877559.1 putative F-box protein [Raphanus sativus]
MKSQQKKISLSPKLQYHSQISTIEKKDGIHIPFDLIKDILPRLPVKSLARFQCVSKQWSSLITNSIMTWALAKPRLHVIFDRRILESSVISLSSYPLNTYKESVPAEQDGHALLHGILNYKIMYQYIRGLISCLTRSSQFLIHNTTTRQSVLLPEINPKRPGCFMDGFFGYDPVENKYKVFCMIRTAHTFEESYQVFTLGDPKKQWRTIQSFGTFLSPTMTTRVCINGKIYFRASVGRYDNIPKPNDSENLLLSFDLRSERFDYLELPDQSRSLTLVNYKGKLGCIRYSDHSADVWVKDHALKQEWCKIDLFMSSSILKSLGDSTRIAGVTLNGEIVIMPRRLDRAKPLYAEYYDPKQEKIRRVELESTFKGQKEDVRIFGFPDHVEENAMSLLDLTYTH